MTTTQAQRDATKRYRERHKEEIKERVKADRKLHPEKYRAAHDKWQKKNPEKRKAQTKRYREKHCEELRAKDKARAHDPKRVAAAAKFRENHREDAVERMRQWKKEHPEHARELSRIDRHKRRAIEAKAEGTHTLDDIKAQYKRQKGRCYWCNEKVGKRYHVDHVIPITRGGSNDPSNLVIACHSCNESKYNKLPHEWHGNGGKMF